MLTFDKRGLSLGSRAVLAKAATNGKFDFDAYEERILALLSIAYKSTIPESILTGVKGAMNLWNAGHRAAGGIRLAQWYSSCAFAPAGNFQGCCRLGFCTESRRGV